MVMAVIMLVGHPADKGTVWDPVLIHSNCATLVVGLEGVNKAQVSSFMFSVCKTCEQF